MLTIGGFNIATPWAQAYRLGPRATKAERKAVTDRAHAEYLAVPDADRMAAVRDALNEAFTTLQRVLPGFVHELEHLPRGA